MFFGSATFGLYNFGKLAQKWPTLMLYWEAVEAKLPAYRTQKEKVQMASRIKLYAIGFCVCAIIEHFATIMSSYHFVLKCGKGNDVLADFYKGRLIQLFSITEYALWKALIGECIYFMGAFVWNYMNVFIIMISLGLSSRFKQINDELKRVKRQPMSEDYWELRRAQYRELGLLCTKVDEAIAPITTIALANNLYYICIQLMNSMK